MMRQILFFDSMLTPRLITIIYWLMLLSALLSGTAMIFGVSGESSVVGGLLAIIIGTIGARVFCELGLVLFKINETLQRQGGH